MGLQAISRGTGEEEGFKVGKKGTGVGIDDEEDDEDEQEDMESEDG